VDSRGKGKNELDHELDLAKFKRQMRGRPGKSGKPIKTGRLPSS
jgi:hypothetical protein